MRVAVIADIHGSLPALEAMLDDIQRRNIDRTINLGDCVFGPSLATRGPRWVSRPDPAPIRVSQTVLLWRAARVVRHHQPASLLHLEYIAHQVCTGCRRAVLHCPVK